MTRDYEEAIASGAHVLVLVRRQWDETRTTSLSALAEVLGCVFVRPTFAHALEGFVASLFADGSPAAMSAAAMIQKGVDRDLYAVALEPEERDAILAVLEDPPAGLEELRGVLARDQRDRASPNRRTRTVRG